MIMQDDRTPEQKQTHRYLVIGTDKFLSGWGRATGGVSYAAWACETHSDSETVYRWVKSRADMRRVRTNYGDYRPRGVGHCHIYVAKPGHPALRG